jgi:ribonuclease J
VLEHTRTAKECGRELVLEPESAYIAHKFWGGKPLLYVPDAPKFHDKALQPEWFKILLNNSTQITQDEIHKNPSNYLVQNSYQYILELLDFPKGTMYLHDGGIPIGEFDPAFKNLERVLNFTNTEFVSYFDLNYFSHPYPCQVKYYCDTIDAKVLIPTHGFNPERLKPRMGRQQLVPELRRTYIFDKESETLIEA